MLFRGGMPPDGPRLARSMSAAMSSLVMYRPSSVVIMPGMHRVRVHPAVAEPAVELDAEQDVGGLGLPVRRELVVLATLEVRVVPHDVGADVAARAQVDDARRRAGEQRRGPAGT